MEFFLLECVEEDYNNLAAEMIYYPNDIRMDAWDWCEWEPVTRPAPTCTCPPLVEHARDLCPSCKHEFDAELALMNFCFPPSKPSKPSNVQ